MRQARRARTYIGAWTTTLTFLMMMVGAVCDAIGIKKTLLAVVAPDGTTVTDFDVEHTKRMHAILVRRDLSGFLHVHPRMARDGTWRIPVAVAGPGAYRLFVEAGSLKTQYDFDLVTTFQRR